MGNNMGNGECRHLKWIPHPETDNVVTCANPECGEVRQFTPTGVRILKKSKCNSQIQKKEKEGKMAKGINPQERHRYYEENRGAILADIIAMGPEAARRKWKIPITSFAQITARWQKQGIQPGATMDMSRYVLPPFPEFSNNWETEVQLSWLETYRALAGK